jgi:hypothetical protein
MRTHVFASIVALFFLVASPSARAEAPALGTADECLPQAYRADLSPEWFGPNGQLRWPPGSGFATAPITITLPPGSHIDRYGCSTGVFFSPMGTPYGARSLPYNRIAQPYTAYIVLHPLEVEAGPAEPWFGEPGGAVQYLTKDNAAKLTIERVIAAASVNTLKRRGFKVPPE